MPYPRRLINEGEYGRPRPQAALVVLRAAHRRSGSGSFVVADPVLSGSTATSQTVTLYAWLARGGRVGGVAGARVPRLAVHLLRRSPTDRVIYRTGVLAKRGVEIPLDAHQQHQLPPGDRRSAGRRRARSRSSRPARTASRASATCGIPTACSRRSTARWRRTHADAGGLRPRARRGDAGAGAGAAAGREHPRAAAAARRAPRPAA